MANSYIFRPRDQIAYIPHHANGDLKHRDTEVGFVTSVSNDGKTVFCRFWHDASKFELRTKANSEATPYDLLVHHKSVPQKIVAIAYRKYVLGFMDDPGTFPVVP